MYRAGTKWENSWERLRATPNLSECPRHHLSKWPRFDKFQCNRYPDGVTKRASLSALHSVVALTACSDGVELIPGCGTIIESDDNTIIVLTSANIIRHPTSKEFGENVLADNLKIFAHSYDGHSFRAGEVCGYDFHYNLAALRFISETPFLPPFGLAKLAHTDNSVDGHSSRTSQPPLVCTKLSRMDDSLDVHSSQRSRPSFLLRPHLRSFKLTPGDGVIVLGRYFAEPCEPMTAPGEYWLERTKYDCKEVFSTNCKITMCGDGGPLINYSGEVIGVAFYDADSTPCLPINIASKWWEHYKKYRKCCQPCVGIEATNLFVAGLGLLERIIAKFPHVSKGVLVEKVISGSCADLAGICVNDIIIQCAGKAVEGYWEFFENIMDHVGDFVEISLIRANSVTPIHLKLNVVEVAPDQINRWPSRGYM